MRICLDSFNPDLIKRFVFMGRLMPAMERLGCTFQYDATNADVILYTRKNTFANRSSSIPKVFRPVHIHIIDKAASRWINDNRVEIGKEADLVIWQGCWLKEKYKKILGFEAKREAIIHNAIDPTVFDGVTGYFIGCKKNVVMLASWAADGEDRPRKRLREMIGIAEAYVRRDKDTGFVVIGDTNGYKVKNDRIWFTGKLPFNKIAGFLVEADAMLNLTYFDNCPSAVVEALVAGVPVVCNNETGAAELVREDGGIVVDIDKPVTRYIHSRKPPEFDMKPVIKALDKVLGGWPKFERPELHIDYAAQKYYDAIKGVVYEH